jgi:predicted AlkP superfamily phosphohydrolase/phosphomutase
MRAVVIGVDGASWELVNHLIGEGDLPHFKDIVANGTTADLRSTLPPITGPAWASFATGLRPENHGVYDFVTHLEDDSRLMTSDDIKAKTFYEMLSEADYRSVLIALPLSTPPRRINGIILPDFFAPRKSYHPKTAERYLKEYRLTPDLKLKGREFIDDLLAFEREHMRVAKEILQDEDWDFFFIHLISSDTISHRHYGDILRNTDIGMEAREVFRNIDGFIGWCVENVVDDDTMLIILSDHGFRVCERTFFINKYLHDKGLLNMRPISEDRIKDSPQFRDKRKELTVPSWMYPLLRNRVMRRVGRFLERTMFKNYNVKAGMIPDPRSSEFFMPTPSSHCLNVNTDDEERVRSVVRDLEELEDGERGVRVFDEVVHSPEANRIFFVPHKDYFVTEANSETEMMTETHFYHDMNGIFLACGPNVRKGHRIDTVTLLDLAPTVLDVYQVPIPESIDGNVLTQIYEDRAKVELDPVEKRTMEEKRRIRSRLRGLKLP